VFHPFLDQPCSDVPDLELSLLDGGERTATVVSETEMVVAVLSRVEFRSLQIAVPSIACLLSSGRDCAISTTPWRSSPPACLSNSGRYRDEAERGVATGRCSARIRTNCWMRSIASEELLCLLTPMGIHANCLSRASVFTSRALISVSRSSFPCQPGCTPGRWPGSRSPGLGRTRGEKHHGHHDWEGRTSDF
jgi:hypothetical protein